MPSLDTGDILEHESDSCNGTKVPMVLCRLKIALVTLITISADPTLHKLTYVSCGPNIRLTGGLPMVGQTLGHYRIIEKIGQGGMGVVYLARDERLDRAVAVKVLPPGLLSEDSVRCRFRKEAMALAKLNHPNIATIHDFNTQTGVDFLVMEHIVGATLEKRIASGPLSESETLYVGLQVLSALGAAHELGIIHRDLKPSNIIVGPNQHVKVLDFGLSKTIKNTNPALVAENRTGCERSFLLDVWEVSVLDEVRR